MMPIFSTTSNVEVTVLTKRAAQDLGLHDMAERASTSFVQTAMKLRCVHRKNLEYGLSSTTHLDDSFTR